MAFVLIYGLRNFVGGSKLYGIDADVVFGGNNSGWTTGQSGAIDFTRSNSADFDLLVSHLEERANETIYASGLDLTSWGAITGAQASGSLERQALTTPLRGPNLQHRQVAVIRLVVNSIQLTYAPTGCSLGIPGSCTDFNTSWDATWQFWSTPPPPA